MKIVFEYSNRSDDWEYFLEQIKVPFNVTTKDVIVGYGAYKKVTCYEWNNRDSSELARQNAKIDSVFDKSIPLVKQEYWIDGENHEQFLCDLKKEIQSLMRLNSAEQAIFFYKEDSEGWEVELAEIVFKEMPWRP